MSRRALASVWGGGISNRKGAGNMFGMVKEEPCVYTVPPELDINNYMIRVINALSSIQDKRTKDTAVARLGNIAEDINIILNPR